MVLTRLNANSINRNPDGSPLLETTEEGAELMLLNASNIELYFDNQSTQGMGTLFVTSKRIIWLNQDQSKGGFQIGFREIMCHALAREQSFHFSHPCLYCQLDVEMNEEEEQGEENEEGKNESNGHQNGNNNSNNNNVNISNVSELRFVPQNVSMLDTMFKAFSKGAELNPDEESEGEGDLIYNDDEVQLGVDQQNALNRLESLLVDDNNNNNNNNNNHQNGQFDDADEDEDVEM